MKKNLSSAKPVDEIRVPDVVVKADVDQEPQLPFPIFQLPEVEYLEQRGILFINGPITPDTLAQPMARLLAMHFDPTFKDEVQLMINSPGGQLDPTWAFIDLMEWVRFPITTIGMGQIASAATMIFVAGDQRVMAPNCMAMIHHFSGMVAGSYPQLVAARKYEEREYEKIVSHYLRHSKYKKPEDVVKNILHDQDHYLTPDEMLKHGLCDVALPHRKHGSKRSKNAVSRTIKG